MRPDEHKSKESRKYQARQKLKGDTSAAEIAEARKKEAKARDRGLGIAAVMRRNADPQEETEEEKEERKLRQAKFSRRKLVSNADRYKEETEQEAMDRDIEVGIDRETTDLVDMLENKEEGSSTFFKFKDEQLFNTNDSQDMMNRNILQLDFTIFEPALETFDVNELLGLNDNEENKDLVQNALNEHPVVLDKPIVPSFSKNAKGYVLFKSQQPAKPNVISEADGIYLRNDGSNHRVIPTTTTTTNKDPKETPVVKDDLDELLALDRKKNVAAPAPPPSSSLLKRAVLPKPGSIKKSTITKPQNKNTEIDDEAWLDDILG